MESERIDRDARLRDRRERERLRVGAALPVPGIGPRLVASRIFEGLVLVDGDDAVAGGRRIGGGKAVQTEQQKEEVRTMPPPYDAELWHFDYSTSS